MVIQQPRVGKKDVGIVRVELKGLFDLFFPCGVCISLIQAPGTLDCEMGFR